MKLVIVESPTKAKTISRYLGKNYKVLASFGHIRDLPKSKLGVDVENNFEPTYTVPKTSLKNLKPIKEAAKKADEILFATDEDREGEAISWHLAEVLKLDPSKVHRITFHEITKSAIEHALATPHHIDGHLVDAQQARRILDRLVGYKLSPFLWRTVRPGLSAGRVQSVTVRLIVDREREIKAFNPEEYWSIDAEFLPKEKTSDDLPPIEAKLKTYDGKKIEKMTITTEADANRILDDIREGTYAVQNIEEKAKKASPPAPFTTSTLQQHAHQRLGFSSKQTMTLAQKLYEGIELGAEGTHGLITYMRTDSVNLSEKFLQDANELVKTKYGDAYTLSAPRVYKTKSKGAQEAHEAIRPTEASRTPESVSAFLDTQMLKLYQLIWQRSVASQMADAELKTTALDIASEKSVFRATGQRVVFDGFMALDPDRQKEKLLPELHEKDAMKTVSMNGVQHFTEPPPRYNDATIIKALEEHGIGRPSTYAPTISTVIDRGYIERDDKKRFVPTDIAYAVIDLLIKHFPNIVDLEFTARMENSLDSIAEGKMEWRPLLSAFYGPFNAQLMKNEEMLEQEAQKAAEGETCPKCGKAMAVKRSRYGKFLACTGYPECKGSKPLPGEENARKEPEPTDEICPECGEPMVKREGRFGAFLSCSTYPKCKSIKNIEIPVKDEQGNPVQCPECKKGTIIQKKSKKGKIFFACNRYPDCQKAFWGPPTGTPCPKCGYATVIRKAKSISCPQEDCDWKEDLINE
ncbi:MAG: type I DNA topoisomerase [bacterium]|nr:type I DNA topoisomerase [bacterium]